MRISFLFSFEPVILVVLVLALPRIPLPMLIRALDPAQNVDLLTSSTAEFDFGAASSNPRDLQTIPDPSDSVTDFNLQDSQTSPDSLNSFTSSNLQDMEISSDSSDSISSSDDAILVSADTSPLQQATCKKEPGVKKFVVPDCDHAYALWCPHPPLNYSMIGCGFCAAGPKDVFMTVKYKVLTGTLEDWDPRCQGTNPNNLWCCAFAVVCLYSFIWGNQTTMNFN